MVTKMLTIYGLQIWPHQKSKQKNLWWIGASGAVLGVISGGQGLRAPRQHWRRNCVFRAPKRKWGFLVTGRFSEGKWCPAFFTIFPFLFLLWVLKCIHSYHSCRWCGLMKQLPKCKTWKIRLDPSAWAPSKKLRIYAYSLPFMDGNRVNYSATICTHLYSTLKHQHTTGCDEHSVRQCQL